MSSEEGDCLEEGCGRDLDCRQVVSHCILFIFRDAARDTMALPDKAAFKKAGMLSFGFRDLKGKGATDMWLSDVPIEQIQHLCGHDDSTTTEIYMKQRWRKTAAPNKVEMAV